MEHFSTDLVEASKAHLTFLTTLHALGVTVTPPVAESLRRYVDLWLPLVHAIQHPSSRDVANANAPSEHRGSGTLLLARTAPTTTKLIPPPDVAWLWHCHRLAPSRYEAYVAKRFGCLLEASPSFAVQAAGCDPPRLFAGDVLDEADAQATRNEWDRAYPDQPFFLRLQETQTNSRPLTSPECRNALDGFDLLASTKSQSTFLWQVARPHFIQDDFLRQGVERYYKFLRLSVKGIVLVPTYQIDLVWHSHILASIRLYNQDCVKICHHKFYHDDSLGGGDRTPGGGLDRAFEATDAIWRTEYGNEPYKVEGTLYRGEPPPSFYNFATWHPMKSGPVAPMGPVGSLAVRPAMVVGGATSTGRKELEQLEWRDVSCDALSSTGETLFIPAVAARSGHHPFHRSRNPQRPGYAFGRNPTHGWGYYSLETREGWEVTYERLRVREAKAHTKLDSYYCRNCCCAVFGRLSPNQLAEQKLLQTKLADIRDQMADVKRICSGDGPPSSSLSSSSRRSPYESGYPVDAILLTSACGGSVFVRNHGYSTSAGCGGGCGGAHHVGGGCGGAHSGGGCGGGGCGGGGCGGGGCGGGGCGGG